MTQNKSMTQLIQQALSALKAGCDVSDRGMREVQNDVSHSQLKEGLKHGDEMSRHWRQRIEQALSETGQGQEKDNKVLESIHEVCRIMRHEAPDAMTRDLGIIASGQLALHYWIAAFGTLRTYAQHAGHAEIARNMEQCLKEAKEADERYNEYAEEILRDQKAQAA